MTTPVIMDRNSEVSFGKMAFVIPAAVASRGVPEPSDSSVRVHKRPAGVFGVARFSGQISEATVDRVENELVSWLRDNGKTVAGETEVAGYDPPWIPGPLRRNEVLIRIAQPADSDRP